MRERGPTTIGCWLGDLASENPTASQGDSLALLAQLPV